MPDVQELILSTMQQLQKDMGEVKVGLGKVQTSVETLCEQRSEQQLQHTACRHDLDRDLAENEKAHEAMWKAINRLTTWGKAIAIVGPILVAVLTVLNILLALGVQL